MIFHLFARKSFKFSSLTHNLWRFGDDDVCLRRLGFAWVSLRLLTAHTFICRHSTDASEIARWSSTAIRLNWASCSREIDRPYLPRILCGKIFTGLYLETKEPMISPLTHQIGDAENEVPFQLHLRIFTDAPLEIRAKKPDAWALVQQIDSVSVVSILFESELRVLSTYIFFDEKIGIVTIRQAITASFAVL